VWIEMRNARPNSFLAAFDRWKTSMRANDVTKPSFARHNRR